MIAEHEAAMGQNPFAAFFVDGCNASASLELFLSLARAVNQRSERAS